jgi:hypothetical protein
MIHIGEKIKTVIHQKGMKITELAKRINKTPPTIYDIFERENVDTGLLMDIGEALQYDFFQHFKPEKLMVNEDQVLYQVPDNKNMYLSITINNVPVGEATQIIQKLKQYIQ